jgi:hypothetical protein
MKALTRPGNKIPAVVIVDWLEGIIMLIYTVPWFPISGAQTDFPFKFINSYKHFSNEDHGNTMLDLHTCSVLRGSGDASGSVVS